MFGRDKLPIMCGFCGRVLAQKRWRSRFDRDMGVEVFGDVYYACPEWEDFEFERHDAWRLGWFNRWWKI